MSEFDISKVSLPKWPAMTVVGNAVTKKQAAEIILRTDGWYYGCNDRKWEQFVWEALGVTIKDNHGHKQAEFESLRNAAARFHRLDVDHLHNSRIMSSWIGGPKGWCNWDGTIGSSN